MFDVFSKEKLEVLFKCDQNGALLVSEANNIEYKLNFQIGADLFRTINGLANNKGGYIIFGVHPDTKELIGLPTPKIDFYLKKIDSEDVRGKILLSCQPNMEFKHYLHNIGVSKFIVFYVEESQNKPHIFLNNYEDIKPGDIYYRYNDSVKKIQYAELSAIIENKRLKEQEKWMKFLGEIAKIGLDNVLIIDAKNGKMISSENYENGILLDESILSKFKLIKEGQFNEILGDPTLKIVGNLSFETESGKYQLSTDYNTILDPNKTHPYRIIDMFNKLVKDKVKTKDGKLLNGGDLTYHRVRFFIVNNKLDEGIDYVYISDVDKRKTYSDKVYILVKEAFSNMTLEEIRQLKLKK